MIKVLVPIADGSEEMEAVTIIDVLRRAGIEVTVASVMGGSKTVSASRGVVIQADAWLDDCLDKSWDMIVLPGGMPGAEHLSSDKNLQGLIRQQLKTQSWLGAICASPAVVLGRQGLLQEFRATCYPAFQAELKQQAKEVSGEAVVCDGKLITSQGPGTALAFALQLVAVLLGTEKAQEVAEPMLAVW